jgi:hypothetical protein
MSIDNKPANLDSSVMDALRAQLARDKGNLDKLAPAYVRAWGEVANVVRNANNPHFGNDYADLSAVLDAMKPAFAKHGLALLQAPGEMADDKVTVVGMLIHESGQFISVKTELPLGSKATAQAAGSAYTYARRYQAQAFAGIAPVDDDGQAASQPPPKREAKEVKEKPDGGGKAELLRELNAIEVSAKLSKLDATAQLEGLKERVRALNDEEVASLYVEKKKSIRGSK